MTHTIRGWTKGSSNSIQTFSSPRCWLSAICARLQSKAATDIHIARRKGIKVLRKTLRGWKWKGNKKQHILIKRQD